MKISVLTPSYNYSEYIADCLDSVRLQDGGHDVEHVVVDDCSEQRATVDLLAARRDQLSVTFRSENLGLARTLNDCVGAATGDWVGWLNADDFYLPGAIASVAQYVRDLPGVDVVYGDCVYVDTRGHLVRLAGQHRMSGFVLRHFGPHIPPCAFFVRRELMSPDAFDPDTRKLMDWEVYLRLHAAGARFGYLPRPLGCFRRHARQESRTTDVGDLAERYRVAQRYGIRRSRLTAAVGKAWHGAMKYQAGAYGRERAVAALVGRSLEWFRDDTALETCQKLKHLTSAGSR